MSRITPATFWQKITVRFLIATIALPTSLLLAGAPDWWAEQSVLKSGTSPDDYAAVNQGQLKFLAIKAGKAMDARLPDGAGTAVHTLLDKWSTLQPDGSRIPKVGSATDDYAAVNLGQLKSVAKPFYDRLIAAGLAAGYPWSGSSKPADDYALANLGQVKNVFSFSLGAPVDTDGDGIPDVDEVALTGTDPFDAYTDGFPAPYNDSYGAYGYAAVERWTGFSSAPVLDTFRQSAGVNTPASAGLSKSRILTKALLSKGTTGSGAVVERIRGWIVPLQDGPWSVSVVMEKGASAGTAMLRLSTDDTPYLATEKLRFSPASAVDSASATVTLEAGKAYYYEVWLVKPDASVDARVDAAPVLL